MSHEASQPFSAWLGPRRAKLLLVGEAFGESEDQMKQPFVGEAGKLLFELLGEAMPALAPDLHAEICESFKYGLAWTGKRGAWFEQASIAATNVLNFRPPENKLEPLCADKASVGGSAYQLPALTKGKYLRPEYLAELPRLEAEIAECQPNLIVALGNTACWALLQTTAIGSIRGTVTAGLQPGSAKVLPTYHPAAIFRQWAWRPIVLVDLMKASREMDFAEVRRPEREVIINPSLADLEAWTARVRADPPELLACDIETASGQITCISFATSPSRAICVPFWQKSQRSWSYWPSITDELAAWKLVQKLLELPCVKLGQNFIYDLQYITRMGILPKQCTEDTMLLHHSLFPELQKGLGFLGSIYSNEASWKLMRRKRADTEKYDE